MKESDMDTMDTMHQKPRELVGMHNGCPWRVLGRPCHQWRYADQAYCYAHEKAATGLIEVFSNGRIGKAGVL